MSRALARTFFWILVFLGRPMGGLRPRRIYNFLGRAGFKSPEFGWYRDRWKNEMWLTPYYFQDRAIIAYGMYDSEVNLLIERLVKPGMICMDVGANIGHMTLHLARKVGPSGKVYAFEPVPEIFRILEGNIARNGLQQIVSANELALADHNGMIQIGYADQWKENQGMGSIVNITNEVATLKRRVETQTIDKFVQDAGITRLDFLKADIQGAEILLLQGGREVFSSLSPDLIMEVSATDLKCGNQAPGDLANMLSSYNYHLYEIRRDGRIGQRLDISRFRSDLAAMNIYCTKKGQR